MDSVEDRHTDVPHEFWSLLRSKMKDGDSGMLESVAFEDERW